MITYIYINDIEHNLIINIFNKRAPLRTVRVTKPKAPWLTEDIKILKRSRDNALATYKSSKTNENWLIYKSLRNRTLSLVRRRKGAFVGNVVGDGDAGRTWKMLGDLNIKERNKREVS